MEKKFYTDDFELFLRESTDDFRMYPSKRVWNSLYNNLHPGRKWPSLAVCLLLISSIVFIGLSHKNEMTGTSNSREKNETNSLLKANQNNMASLSIKSPEIAFPVINSSPRVITAGPEGTHDLKNSRTKQEITASIPAKTFEAGTSNRKVARRSPGKRNNTGTQLSVRNNGVSTSRNILLIMPLTNPVAEANHEIIDTKIAGRWIDKDHGSVAIANNPHELRIVERNFASVIIPAVTSTPDELLKIEKEWIEDFAFHNQPIPSIKSRLQYQVYLTPSVGFRTLRQTASYSPPARLSLVNSVPDGRNALHQHAAFNLEAGYSVLYARSKSMHIKGGLQFNYTNYRIDAHQLGHSTFTNLIIKDPYSSNGIVLNQRSTSLANLTGNVNDKKLNSSTFQVSLPLGADVKFAGRHNLQWFVGANLQPTYVLFGNAYLVSADSRSYVYDSKFLSKWNLNSAVEAFVSYRTKKGITFNAGPQFRYQLYSTYDSKYAYDEKLYNFGLKLGLTKNF